MMYITIDQKIKHLNTLKHQAAEIERRIKQLEKDLQKSMTQAYAEVAVDFR